MTRWLFILLAGAAALMVGCEAELGSSPGQPRNADAAPADSAVPCPAADPVGHLTALRTSDAIAVDGVLDEATWQGARSVQFSSSNGRSDNDVEVWMAWDDDTLFLAYHVMDKQLETGDDEDNVPIHLEDGAELYLDTAHNATMAMDGDDYHFIVNIAGEIALGVSGPFAVETTPVTGGYTMELGIPWNDVGGTPQGEHTMGMLLGNNDRDNGMGVQFDWTGVIDNGNGSYARPHLWGDLLLSSAVASEGCQ